MKFLSKLLQAPKNLLFNISIVILLIGSLLLGNYPLEASGEVAKSNSPLLFNDSEGISVDRQASFEQPYSDRASSFSLESGASIISMKNKPEILDGSNWIEILVSSSSYDKSDPSIAVDSTGNIYGVVQFYSSGSSTYNITIFRSTDQGQTWVKWWTLFSSSDWIGNPDIAIDLDDDDIYVAYEQINGAHNDIWIWPVGSPVVAVDTDTQDDRYPSIAIDYAYGTNNYIYIAYQRINSVLEDRELQVRRSTNHGASGSWNDGSTAWHFHGGLDSDVYTGVDIAVSPGGTVYVTYAKGPSISTLYDIVVEYGSRSDSGLDYFENEKIIRDGGPTYALVSHPSIAVSRHSSYDTVVVAYETDAESGNIYAKYSTNGGSTWSSVGYGVATTASAETYPQIAAPGMGTTSNTLGDFCIVYKSGSGSSSSANIATASHTSLDNWTLNHAGSQAVYSVYPRTFGITTVKLVDSWVPAIAYTAYSGYHQLYFEMDLAGAAGPTLVAPADAASITNPVTFSWGSLSSATSYRLQVDDNLAFSTPDVDWNGSATEYTPSPLAEGDFYWRVRAADAAGFLTQWSEVWSFTLISMSLTITSPTGSDQWVIGSTHEITWNSVGNISWVDIVLYNGTSNLLGRIATDEENDGSFSWLIPWGVLNTGSNYWIALQYDSDGDEKYDIYTYSDDFELKAPEGTLSVSSPTSSSIWAHDTSVTITWSSTGAIPIVDIFLLKGTDVLGWLAIDTQNTGSYVWTVNSTLAPGSDYAIGISSDYNGDFSPDFYATSDDFTIAAPATSTEPSDTTSEDASSEDASEADLLSDALGFEAPLLMMTMTLGFLLLVQQKRKRSS